MGLEQPLSRLRGAALQNLRRQLLGAANNLAFEVGRPPSGIEPRSASGVDGRNAPEGSSPRGS